MDKRNKDSRQEAAPRDRSGYGEGSNAPGASVHLGDVSEMDYQEHLNRAWKGFGTSRGDLVDKPDGTVLHIKPMKYTLGLGIPGFLLLLGACLMHLIIERYGNPFVTVGGQNYSGLVRLIAMLSGGMMLIIAWPIRKPVGWSIEEQEQYEDSKQWAANRRMKDDRE
ncbi:hypothetical protein KDL29_10990 [bacterium]|nr:hypothetical protein [bacterium]